MTDFLLSRIERGVNDFCRVRASTSRAESFLQRFPEKIRTGVGLAGALVKPEGDHGMMTMRRWAIAIARCLWMI
jgi:hypothetical protein